MLVLHVANPGVISDVIYGVLSSLRSNPKYRVRNKPHIQPDMAQNYPLKKKVRIIFNSS